MRLLLFERESIHAELTQPAILLTHFQGLLVAAQLMGIEQSGHDLVQHVPRGPDWLAGLHAVDERFGKRRQIARVRPLLRQRRLALGQRRDDRVHAFFEARVTGGGVGQRAGRQIMPQRMAANFDLRSFPATIGLDLRRQAGRDSEHVQQPFGLELEQHLLVALLCRGEGAVEQTDGADRERPRLLRHNFLGCREACQKDQEEDHTATAQERRRNDRRLSLRESSGRRRVSRRG